MAFELTARQAEILQLIQATVEQTGFPPTRAEIAKSLGFKSANAAEDHLRALEKKGYIVLTPGASRGIRLTQAADTSLGNTLRNTASRLAEQLSDAMTLPVVGRVAAGSPILATQNVAREIAVGTALFDRTPDFLLEVRGHSMRDAGILDGDLLAVKKSEDARSGQIVVARIDEEVTVKRLLIEKNRVLLLPENADFEPIVVTDAERLFIEGIAVGLIRTKPLH
jgi:repressor LexA